MRLARIVLVVVLLTRIAGAANYYVSTTGSNSNSGTSLASPFLTIQQAANAAHAGDNVYVEGGTYAETVTVANSGTASAPITFQPYQGANVTITGLNTVSSGWSNYSGSIYSSSVSGGASEVFVNGQLMTGARSPNPVYKNPLCQAYSTVSSATMSRSTPTTGTITDTTLTGNSWTGSALVVRAGDGYYGYSTTVTGQSGTTLNYQWPYYTGTAFNPRAGNPYYLCNSLAAISSTNQWYYDPTAKKLYLNSVGGANPGTQTVQVRQRQYGFDLGRQSNITVSGFRLLAAGVNIGGNNDTINHCQLLYSSAFAAPPGASSSTPLNTNGGITISGQNNTVRNSEIGYCYGSAVMLTGANNTVTNNVIHDVNWEGDDSAFVVTAGTSGGRSETIANNTMYNAGRSGIATYSNTPNMQIQHNDISRFGFIASDLAGVYTALGKDDGSVVAYNRVHDAVGTPVGLYLDNSTSGYTIHNNLVNNVAYGITVNMNSTANDPPNNDSVYSNTLSNVTTAMSSWGPTGYALTNVKTYNNLTNVGTWTGTDIQNNRTQTANQFVNSAAGNYTLTANGGTTKKAVGYGMTDAQHPVDPYTGSQPDAGAFAYGEPTWTAGANFQTWLASNQVAAPLASAVCVKQSGSIVTTGSLLVGNTSSTSSNNRSFLKFDLSGVAASTPIQSAVLRIYEVAAPTSAAGSVTLYRVASTWTNSNLSYNQSVDTINAISGFYDPTNLDLYTDIDVTSLVQGWLNNPSTDFGISLRGTETSTGTSKYFDGFYGVTAPQLIITLPERKFSKTP